MAQATAARDLASLLECPICLDDFTDPRMLVCLHILCYQCLANHITHTGKDGKFKCLTCRKELDIPQRGAGAFPTNFFINSFEGVKIETVFQENV